MIKTIQKKMRLIIFFLIFVVVSPIIVLYANGDIFNDGWSILKTGGVYVNSAPNGSSIFIDNKLKGNTSFFERDLLIKNLRPGVYKIDVKKDGFNVWSKNITVLNNMVTDANVFILPKIIDFRDIPQKIDSEKKIGTSTIIIKKDNQEYFNLLKIFSISTTTKKQEIENLLGTKDNPIVNGKIRLWVEDKKVFVSWNGKLESAPKYFCDNGECFTSIEVINLIKEPEYFDFLLNYDGVIIVSSNNKIFAVQIEKNPLKEIQLIYEGVKPSLKIYDGLLYIKDGELLREYSI